MTRLQPIEPHDCEENPGAYCTSLRNLYLLASALSPSSTLLMVPYGKGFKHTVTIHFSFTSLTRLLMAFGCFREDPSWIQQYQRQCQTVI